MLAILYLIGMFIRLDYTSVRFGINAGVRAGSLHVGWQDGPIPAESDGLWVGRAKGRTRWLPELQRGTLAGPPIVTWGMLELPLWPVVAAAGAVALRAQWRVVQIRRSGCHRCGYPRVGIARDAPCPECGLEVGKQ